MLLKRCAGCKLELSIDLFYKEPRRADGFRRYCKVCSNQACKKYRAKHPTKVVAYREANKEKRRDSRLLSRYGLSLIDYEKMLKQQGNVCSICKLPESRLEYRTGKIARLAVDHCHKTGKVRSILCNRCNVTLGKVEDSEELLLKLIEYLKEHSNNGQMGLQSTME